MKKSKVIDRNRITEIKTLLMAVIFALSLLVKVPGDGCEVRASGLTTDNNITSGDITTTGTASDNSLTGTSIDPNGTLGKNSDIGVEVTESIKGTAGKDRTSVVRSIPRYSRFI